MKKKIEKIIQEKLINPVLHSRAPVSEVSLGVAVGVFLGLTPTVGVQMYLVAVVWSIYRYIFRRHFNLPVGVAMVWLQHRHNLCEDGLDTEANWRDSISQEPVPVRVMELWEPCCLERRRQNGFAGTGANLILQESVDRLRQT